MNIQPVYFGSNEPIWHGKRPKRSTLNDFSTNQPFETAHDVKIEYINAAEETSATETPSLGVIMEKVDPPDRKPNKTNYMDYNLDFVKNKLTDGYGPKGNIYGESSSQGNQGVTSLIEKFESKMMQNISTTYTEVLNEISKSMNRIQVLAKDNAEYQEDCLRTNVSEISRYLKIFPKRTQPLQIDEENMTKKTGDNENTSDGEEEAGQQPNDIFFGVEENDAKMNIITSQKIKEEPFSDDLMFSEEPEMGELPIFQDVNDEYVNEDVNHPYVNDEPINNESVTSKEINGQSNDSVEKEWKCSVCANSFSSKFALQRHQRRNQTCSAAIIESKKKIEETADGKKLPLLKFYHTLGHQKFNPDVPYKPCFFCPHAFQRITELVGHLQVAHPNEDMDHLADILPSLSEDDIKPDRIRKRLNEETYVKDEDQSEFKGGLTKCSFCPNEVASFSRLLSHVRYVHPDSDKTQGHWTLKIYSSLEERYPSKRVPCDTCGSEIKIENLYKHKSNHNKIMKDCPEPGCGKSIQSNTFKEHLKIHTQQEWLCNECGRSFKKQQSYKRHIATHDPNFKGFECTPCNKIFDRRASLTTHNSLVHEGTKRFMCQHCSYAASLSGNLTLHIRRVHSKEKPSQCEQCDYKTIGGQELMRHVIAVHERDKHFRCDVCAWTTPRKHLMDMHNRLNCKKPPFSEEDRAKSKAILAAEAGPTPRIYNY